MIRLPPWVARSQNGDGQASVSACPVKQSPHPEFHKHQKENWRFCTGPDGRSQHNSAIFVGPDFQLLIRTLSRPHPRFA